MFILKRFCFQYSMELNCFSSGAVYLVIKNEERCWCNIFLAIEIALKLHNATGDLVT